MSPPAGETAAHVAARIVLYMSLYVYSGPTTPVPAASPTSDMALAVVSPAHRRIAAASAVVATVLAVADAKAGAAR